ncbi:MAG: DUF5103 domain-containing protein [Bacteroidales bacterium]
MAKIQPVTIIKVLLTIIILATASVFSHAFAQIIYDKTYKPEIKTVLIYKKGWELSAPVIEMESNEQVELVFDELGTKSSTYAWKLEHCNMFWEKDQLEPVEFLSGFENGDITVITFSQNTLVNYVNYKLNLPLKKNRILKSGNYIIKVYERNNPDKVLLTRRFYVMEPKVEINGIVDQLKVNVKEGLNQRLDLEIKTYDSEILNPREEIGLKVIKNGFPEKNFANIKPSFISDNIIKYTDNDSLCFAGGNEFRHFDIKSIKFLSDRLQDIKGGTNGTDVYLTADENQSHEPYKFVKDINGNRTVKLENSDISNYMADYCNVIFSLKTGLLLQDGDYYVFGAFNDWQFNDSNKLQYDPSAKLYFLKTLLKQGYYNYQYLFKTNDDLLSGEENYYILEGNHFQTENEYQVFVYYRDISAGFDRLIGYKVISSSNAGKF